jgi:hypothetical protein
MTQGEFKNKWEGVLREAGREEFTKAFVWWCKCFQIVMSCKRLWTNSTNERFLSCMNSCMCFQSWIVCKRLWTKRATEWILPCMNSWMCFQMIRLWKDFEQRVQLNGFSPVWILECAFRWSYRAKDFGQRVQLNGFSPVWILECSFRLSCRAKDFEQILQLNGFSPVWTLAWNLSRDESLKDLSHTEHLKCLSEWAFKWILRMSDVGKDFVHWVQQWRFSLAFVTSSLKLTHLNKYTIKIVYTCTKWFSCLCTF